MGTKKKIKMGQGGLATHLPAAVSELTSCRAKTSPGLGPPCPFPPQNAREEEEEEPLSRSINLGSRSHCPHRLWEVPPVAWLSLAFIYSIIMFVFKVTFFVFFFFLFLSYGSWWVLKKMNFFFWFEIIVIRLFKKKFNFLECF